MKQFHLFDLIGPQMIGPSSSHTAGAARLGNVAWRLAEHQVRKAYVTLYGSFATTGAGHGTDRAIAAGLLGYPPEDELLRDSFALAKEQGCEITFQYSDEKRRHPNTAKITVERKDGATIELVGASIGGGSIEIQEINGMEVSFGCDYPTLLIFHYDRPGVIHSVIGVLAEKNINVAFMRVIRSSRHQRACMVIETDTSVESAVAAQIRTANPDIWEVCRL